MNRPNIDADLLNLLSVSQRRCATVIFMWPSCELAVTKGSIINLLRKS